MRKFAVLLFLLFAISGLSGCMYHSVDIRGHAHSHHKPTHHETIVVRSTPYYHPAYSHHTTVHKTIVVPKVVQHRKVHKPDYYGHKQVHTNQRHYKKHEPKYHSKPKHYSKPKHHSKPKSTPILGSKIVRKEVRKDVHTKIRKDVRNNERKDMRRVERNHPRDYDHKRGVTQ